MSTREFFAQRLAVELPAFNNVIRALPGDRLDYRPHEKNTPAGNLAWQLAIEMSQIPELFQTGEIRWGSTKKPETIEEWPDLLALDLLTERDVPLSAWAARHGVLPVCL